MAALRESYDVPDTQRLVNARVVHLGKNMTYFPPLVALTAGTAKPSLAPRAPHRATKGRRSIRQLDPSMADRVIEYMWEHLCDDLTLTTIAAIACTSRFHFGRMFRQTFERSTMQYLLLMRVSAARLLLIEGQHSVADIASHLGFCDQSHLCRSFRRLVGMPPGEFARTEGRGASVDPVGATRAIRRAP